MSKERARLRAARQAEAERQRAARARKSARRARRRAVLSRLVPQLPDRRTGRIGRRSRGERAGILAGALVALAAIWLLVDELALRIVLVVLLVLALPAVVVLVLGRRT
ncbi:hypothetical protein [Micromonospora zhanjiangensis]|uniref:Uncharacterized protein n=1 Tax=Micromonospora zhanjiangensis TaxID=1522057 RepID=A0ABV8KQ53_9ACTN